MNVVVVGVHPVRHAPEPVHLVELRYAGRPGELDLGRVTQHRLGLAPENRQVPYDETALPAGPDGSLRVAFFLHFLDLTRPLDTPFGPVALPPETPIPLELEFIRYEPPC